MSTGLVAFEQLWQRIRRQNDELRPRLAAWLRRLIPTRGRSLPSLVRGYAGRREDGWRLTVYWLASPTSRRQHRSSPGHEFPISPIVPEELTEDDTRVLGLPPYHLHYVTHAWLSEVLAEAWVEAGLAAQPFGLELDNSPFRGLGQRLVWTDLVRAAAYRVVAPLPPSIPVLPVLPAGEVALVAPPTPLTLPETPAALREACSAGEPGAVRAWAAALAAVGDQASADLLFWLDAFSAATADRVRSWFGLGALWVYANASQYWWGTGEEGTEPGDNGEPATRLAQLLAGWNVYYAAVEWMLRQFSLRSVHIHASYFADGAQGQTFEIDLAAGGRLVPLEETLGVTELHVDSPRDFDGDGEE